MLARLNNPHQQFPSLHIGGTNGKGSTAAMVSTLLEASGYRVGLYTSPHLIDFRERFRIQGQPISEERVLELIVKVNRAIPSHYSLTFFEYATIMAFQYFAEEKVEMAVVEVGMGGRLDATNVLHPMGVVITNVSFDHQEFLGKSLSAIAYEKAGIIKKNIPLIVGSIPTEAKEVIDRQAEENGVPYARLGREFQVTPVSFHHFDFHGLAHSWTNLPCSLPGYHQFLNAGCALALLESLHGHGIDVSEDVVRGSLGKVVWEGRLEVLGQAPLVLLDGAHNPAAATFLAEYLTHLRTSQPIGSIILIVGMLEDKDHQAFLAEVLPVVDHVILTHIRQPHSATIQKLRSELGQYSHAERVSSSSCIEEAWDFANQLATKHDVICVTGSLFLVGELKSLLGSFPLQTVRG